jgi:K+-sensing histidine kinase KdpD
MRDEFVSSAAHVLRTPVGIIEAHLELLADERPGTRRKSVAAIMRQCERIVRITDNLIAVARLRSNSLTLHNERIELAGVVNEAAAWADAGLAGLGLERYVTAELVEAARGVVGPDAAGKRRQDWIQFPTIEVPNG